MAGESLKRTHTSTGSKKKFTYSVWFKSNVQFTSNSYLFALGPDGLNQDDSRLYISGASPNKLTYTATDAGISGVVTDDGIRDFGSWYHFMVVVDTTISHEDDRTKLYINGVRKDVSYITTATQNANISHNTTGFELILGSYRENSVNYSAQGYYTDIFNVDGQALTPDVFGFYKNGDGYISAGSTQATDFRPGQWVPKSPSVIKNVINDRGGFGVNGFYLPMNDSSNFGADFHTTPNSIITLKGEDLPQPRNGAPDTTDAYVSQLRSDPYAANLVLAVPGISTATGVNLVTNGSFDNGTTGWTAQDTTLSVDNGKLKVYTLNTNYGSAIQTVTGLTIGQRYTFQVNMYYVDGSFVTALSGASGSVNSGWKSADFVWTHSFTAVSTSLTIDFQMNNVTNITGLWDNVILKQEDTPRDYSADIKGSGTNKTLTATGTAGVGYELGNYYGSAMTFDGGTNESLDLSSVDTDLQFGSDDFTMECWVYNNGDSGNQGILGSYYNSSNRRSALLYLNSSDALILQISDDGTQTESASSVNSNPVETGQWNHVAGVKEGNTISVFINGVCSGINTNTYTSVYTNTNEPFQIGAYDTNSNTFNGNIQDVRVYKGVAKYKGGFDVPRPYTPVGIATWRATTDTTANNFATLNPLLVTPNSTLSDGNLSVTGNQTSGYTHSSTIAVSSGKWYCEMRATQISNIYFGIVANITGGLNSDSVVYNDALRLRMTGDLFIYLDGSSSPSQSFSSGYSAGDIVAVAFDVDAGTATWYVNGTSVGSYSTGISGKTWAPTLYANTSGEAALNFGQNPTFSGQVTAGTNTDANGKGLFKYVPPTGFLALCEDNLPTPAIADPGEYMRTVLYSGDGGDGHSITGLGFQPDLVWIKERTDTSSHQWFDTVRGAGVQIGSNATTGDRSFLNRLTSFDSDGFTVGNSAAVNSSSDTFVAWCWKAGGAAVSNTDGSITSQVSANQTAGFSIVTYTGNNTESTVGHGLNKTPGVIIVKKRNGTGGDWPFHHHSLATQEYLVLNLTNAEATSSTLFYQDPTSSVFYIGTGSNAINANGGTYVAYCWTEIEGFSKFGSYDGNGDADGPFVYCGFKPAWIMVKRSDTADNWIMFDSSRSSTNPVGAHLRANTDDEELAFGTGIDIISNGFKMREAPNALNNASGTYVFMAFAESPFKTANAK